MIWVIALAICWVAAGAYIGWRYNRNRPRPAKCPMRGCAGIMLQHQHYPNLTECCRCRYLILKS